LQLTENDHNVYFMFRCVTLKEGKLNRAVVLDEQQAKAIREWLNAHNKSLIADVTLMMQAAVLRVGDAVALRFDEVINGEIDIEEQKTGKRKALTLPAPVVQMIARRRAEFPHDVHVFRSQRNRSMNKQAPVRREEVSKQIAEAAKAIGIHGTVSAHSFRKLGQCHLQAFSKQHRPSYDRAQSQQHHRHQALSGFRQTSR
jgi:integrase